jgi:hypothetical protein
MYAEGDDYRVRAKTEKQAIEKAKKKFITESGDDWDGITTEVIKPSFSRV